MPEVKTTHPQRVRFAQPRENPSRSCWEVHRPIRRRDRVKIAPTNVSQAPEDEGTHLRHDPIVQPCGDDPHCSYRVIRPRRQRGRLKTRSTNVSQTETSGNAYHGLYKPIFPLPRNADDPRQSTSIRGLQYSLQSSKKNLQNVSRDNKSIASSMHPSANISISARRDLPNRVTTLQSLKPSHQQASNSQATDYIHLESLSTHSFDL